jgi:hypothetical protein
MAEQKIMLAGQFRQIELTADGAISPGMLLEASATGCTPHATSVGFAERMFAMEDALQGDTVDDDYAADDPVQIALPVPGALVMAMLKAGTNYTKGTQLFSYGDGTLRATTGTPKQLIAIVVDAIDLSASGAVDTLTKVRVV